ncbi:MAG: YqhA family protein [Coriobacteriia bacterium]|nr:YqhA family protein [Coriobacteriia bacterium]
MVDGKPRKRFAYRTLIGGTRFFMTIPVIALFTGSVSLVLLGAFQTVTTVMKIVSGAYKEKDALVSFITLADMFLLATVIYIIALGLFELFVDPDVPLPAWLEIRTLEDLKEKLLGVVVVVLAVYYLGYVFKSSDPMAMAAMGIGIAAVIAASAYFGGKMLKKPKADPCPEVPTDAPSAP